MEELITYTYCSFSTNADTYQNIKWQYEISQDSLLSDMLMQMRTALALPITF